MCQQARGARRDHIGRCLSAKHVVSTASDSTLRMWLRKSGRCMRTVQTAAPLVALHLHPSGVLLTAVEGRLTAWDVLAGGERLRTIELETDGTEQGSRLTLGGKESSRVIMLEDKVIVDLDRNLKVVHVPLPARRGSAKSKES